MAASRTGEPRRDLYFTGRRWPERCRPYRGVDRSRADLFEALLYSHVVPHVTVDLCVSPITLDLSLVVLERKAAASGRVGLVDMAVSTWSARVVHGWVTDDRAPLPLSPRVRQAYLAHRAL